MLRMLLQWILNAVALLLVAHFVSGFVVIVLLMAGGQNLFPPRPVGHTVIGLRSPGK